MTEIVGKATSARGFPSIPSVHAGTGTADQAYSVSGKSIIAGKVIIECGPSAYVLESMREYLETDSDAQVPVIANTRDGMRPVLKNPKVTPKVEDARPNTNCKRVLVLVDAVAGDAGFMSAPATTLPAKLMMTALHGVYASNQNPKDFVAASLDLLSSNFSLMLDANITDASDMSARAEWKALDPQDRKKLVSMDFHNHTAADALMNQPVLLLSTGSAAIRIRPVTMQTIVNGLEGPPPGTYGLALSAPANDSARVSMGFFSRSTAQDFLATLARACHQGAVKARMLARQHCKDNNLDMPANSFVAKIYDADYNTFDVAENTPIPTYAAYAVRSDGSGTDWLCNMPLAGNGDYDGRKHCGIASLGLATFSATASLKIPYIDLGGRSFMLPRGNIACPTGYTFKDAGLPVMLGACLLGANPMPTANDFLGSKNDAAIYKQLRQGAYQLLNMTRTDPYNPQTALNATIADNTPVTAAPFNAEALFGNMDDDDEAAAAATLDANAAAAAQALAEEQAEADEQAQAQAQAQVQAQALAQAQAQAQAQALAQAPPAAVPLPAAGLAAPAAGSNGAEPAGAAAATTATSATPTRDADMEDNALGRRHRDEALAAGGGNPPQRRRGT
ncbi:hypothetical protein HXX76_016162 [Chlamydomonas incerta]|uniref:Uncharacterized protein n=1 Tax=Chlamydomonas incerta TaxID=51695 RepID=A0A835S7P4_CHLIN|nr:hypothetical protein HXX76_016162 [Chlamydomonas incerta]|eukprot:KAG2422272.1 hypothetical protein HXX76_016162 [Chlamydomonas incerta]